MKKILFIKILVICFCNAAYAQKKGPADSSVVVYKHAGTSELKMKIYTPRGFDKSKNYPAMIFFFGGGWISGNIRHFENQAKYFSDRGLITVLADYRVSSKHKTTPFQAVKDGKSAIRYLRMNAKKLNIDTGKIIAAGGSAGGHVAAAADLTFLDENYENKVLSSRPNSLVLFNPVFDNGPLGYGYDRIGDRYKEISPIDNIKKGASPTIVFLGTKDKLIPVETAYLYKSKMENVGSRCELYLYPDQEHGFFNYKGDKQYFYKTLVQADIFLASLGYLEGEPHVERFFRLSR